MNMLMVVVSTAAGTLISALLACVPGLHVYNLLGLGVVAAHALALHGAPLPAEVLVPFTVGATVGFAMVNTIPSIILAAPDESALFTVLPGQKYMLAGFGREAVRVTAAGGLFGAVALALFFGALAPVLLPTARRVLNPHAHWIIWCVICFMLMSEWPVGGRLVGHGWSKFRAAWRPLGAGLLTFALSGFLGFAALYRSPVAADASFQSLMPVFIGLFTLPWLLMNIIGNVEMPRQNGGECGSESGLPPRAGARILLAGAAAGSLGGGFAAFFPAITGGVGGFLAGHATAIRDDRTFLASQGASKLVYYAGGILLFFVPGLHMTRGGAARLLGSLYQPRGHYDFYMALAAAALSAVLSFLLVGPLARVALALVGRCGCRRISLAALSVAVGLVLVMTGAAGLVLTIAGCSIGMIPLLFGARRMNCLGVILLPVACNMSGFGPSVAAWLDLL